MSRLSDAILQGDSAYAKGRAPMVDLQYGGQNGYAPNLAEWVSQTRYVRRNLVCLLLEAPRGFQLLPDPQFWVSALKSMVEVHAQSIDGFNSGLEVAVEETAVSGGGEMQEDFSNITRARSNPAFTFKDMYGRPIQNFLHDWIIYLIGDPDSKVPMISTLSGTKPGDLLGDIYSATMLFFEPDPTHTKVAKAWLTTNMYPKKTGDINGKRDLTSPGELSDLSIDFTGITQTGMGVMALAQALFSRVNLNNANPNLRPGLVTGIASDVEAIGRGYKVGAETLGSQAILRN
jgi:hypothetical protein